MHGKGQVMPTGRMAREDRAALMRETRRRLILAAAMLEASAVGYRNITREAVAARAKVSAGSVNHEFGTIGALKDVVMARAVEIRQLDVIAQGLADGHSIAQAAPDELRKAAVNAIT